MAHVNVFGRLGLRIPLISMTLLSVLMSASAIQAQGRIGSLQGPSSSQKGSVLIYPAVEIHWDRLARVTQDTLISITNDTASEVNVRFIYINGDPPRELNGDRQREGWNHISDTITLTPDQPMYFSAVNGEPAGVTPFRKLSLLGQPDPDGVDGVRVLRGFIIAVAVNAEGEEIHWNHLAGTSTSVNYDTGGSWEYGAMAFQAIKGNTGDEPDSKPGQILLDGIEYQAPFEKLCLNFFSYGACLPSQNSIVLHHDTDVTLLPLDGDFRKGLTFPPVTTIASYEIWNQNEIHFEGTQYKFTCWDQRLLSKADPTHHHFSREVLQTDMARAVIDAVPDLENCEDGLVVPSAMVGVSSRTTTFSEPHNAYDNSGKTLIGDGCEEAAILFTPTVPGEEEEPDDDTSVDDEIDSSDKGNGGSSDDPANNAEPRLRSRR